MSSTPVQSERIREEVIRIGLAVVPLNTESPVVGGVTVTPRLGDNLDTYLKLADTMLYDAKRFGRNMVVWAGRSGEQWREK